MSKGFGSDERIGAEQRFVTVQPIGSRKAAYDMLPKAVFPVSLIAINPEAYPAAYTAKERKRRVVVTGHSFRVGDILRWTVGNNRGVESTVDKIIDANTIQLAGSLDSEPQLTDEFLQMRHITLTISETGELSVSSGPVQFVRDSLPQQVIEDTATPANNRPLPSMIMVEKDGIMHPVTKDTATPSNTLAVPVEIVGADGTVINITAGDINVQTSHLGANHDSMRIGDGTNLMGVNASNEALTRDADAITELVAIKGLDFATQTTLAAVLAKIIAAPATEAKQDTTITALADLLTELQLKADLTETQPVSAASLPLPTGAATEATLASVLAKIIAAPATEAKQDTMITSLTSLDGKDYATQTTLAALLTELQLKADLTETQPVSAASLPLPAGAATEATLAAVLAKIIAAPATEAKQDAIILELDAIKDGQNLTVLQQIDLIDTASNNIPDNSGAGLELIADTGGSILKEIQIIEDIGAFMELRIGAGTGNFLCNLPLGGGNVKVNIPANSRLSIRTKETGVIVSSGKIAMNLLGDLV